MSFESDDLGPQDPEGESFPVVGAGALELLETGCRWPGSSRRAKYLAYRDLLHVSLTNRALRVSTPSGSHAVLRSRFRRSGDVVLAHAALRARISELPRGENRLAAMSELDHRFQEASRFPRLTLALIAACVLVALLQLTGPEVTMAGALRLGLTLLEPWRAVTAHFLHGFVDGAGLLSPHLLLNMLCLWAIGGMVERLLGPVQTVLVIAAGAVGSVWACLFMDYQLVVGASGLVMALVGALVWLEFRRPERIPAAWRISRPFLVGFLVFQFVIEGFFPIVASAAHWGGMMAGLLAAAWLTRSEESEASSIQRSLVAASAGLTALAFLAFGWALWMPEHASVRRAEMLLQMQDAPAVLMNDEAWTIAVSDTTDEDALEVAHQLAERAVAATGRGNPDLLDTLAEVSFLLGRGQEALGIIEEAILLSPLEPYFREQRRRFLGERDRDDRPPPPGATPPATPDPRLPPPSDDSLLV